MKNAIKRSVGYESVPRELVAITVERQREQDQSRVNAYLYASVGELLCGESEYEYEPDYQSGCLKRGFEMSTGANGFDY